MLSAIALLKHRAAISRPVDFTRSTPIPGIALRSPLTEPQKATDSDPVVSVLITNWNGLDVLRNCLQSVFEHTKDISFEVILVDDASSDGSVEMVRRDFPEVHIVAREHNGGFVRANNDGAQHAHGRHIMLLNSDTVLQSNAVEILSDYLDAHPLVGVCGGWLLNPDGTSQISYGYEPSLRVALVDAFFLNDAFPRAGFPNKGVVPTSRNPHAQPVEYVSGADLFIRTEIVKQLGLFDERFEAYCEEVDLCHRVKSASAGEVHFVPEARIIHVGGYSYNKQGKKQMRIQYASYYTFLKKYHGDVYTFAVRLLFAWHYFMKLAVRALRWGVASPSKRTSLWKGVLGAFYAIRYSLSPPGSDHAP